MIQERLAELVERAADNALSADEDQALAGLLADPAMRRDAVAHRRAALLIHSQGGRDAATVAALAVATVAGGASGRRRGVWREIGRRQTWRHWSLVAAVAAVLLLVLGGWWLWPDARAVRNDAGSILAPGQVAGALQYPDGSRIVLAEASDAVLDADGHLRLNSGKLQADIAPQAAGTTFSIAAAHGVISVVGTSFSATASTEQTLVRVTGGRVRISDAAGSQAVELPAGTVGVLDAEGPGLLPGALLAGGDRRPVLGVSMCNGSYPGNQRGWFQDEAFDSTDAAGFRTRMLEHATRLNRTARDCGARGVIVWGLEGWHRRDFYYVGDPRRLAVLAPEMDVIADAFFARLGEGGLATGVVLKPGRVVNQDGVWTWRQTTVDVRAELEAKIGYAQRRWGCSLYFYGFNLTPHGQTEALAGRAWVDADVLPWRDLLAVRQTHPEATVIPEYQTLTGWGVAPGWRDGSDPSLPPQVIEQWQRPPLVIAIQPEQTRLPALREALGQGATPLLMIAPEADPGSALEIWRDLQP